MTINSGYSFQNFDFDKLPFISFFNMLKHNVFEHPGGPTKNTAILVIIPIKQINKFNLRESFGAIPFSNLIFDINSSCK